MAGGDPSEFLAMMGRRVDLLRAFDGRAAGKSELEDRLDVSRSTIDRGIRELEDRELVERADGGYRPTLTGKLALQEYERFQERVGGLDESGSLLSALDGDVEVDPSLLAGATVVERDRTSPHRPVEELYGIVEEATEVRAFAPAIYPQQIETYRTNVADGMRADLVLTAEVVERMVAEYAEAFETTVATDVVRLWQATDDLPYSLLVAETPDGPVAAVMVYADRGILGCIHNDDPDAVAWAERRFERERRRATRLI